MRGADGQADGARGDTGTDGVDPLAASTGLEYHHINIGEQHATPEPGGEKCSAATGPTS